MMSFFKTHSGYFRKFFVWVLLWSCPLSAYAVDYRISGKIFLNGADFPGVTVAVTGTSSSSTITGSDGIYAVEVPEGGDYTWTPSKLNYSFSPVSVSTVNFSANISGSEFNATLNTYTVSGTVTADGSPLPGVLVSVTGSAATSATTDGSGNYSFTLDGNGNYTITPTKTNYTFTPASVSTTTLSGNWTNNFAASTHTVSGTITVGGLPLSGVTVSVSGSSTTSTTTDGSGNYSFELVVAGDYTLIPSKLNYTFTPATLSTTTLAGNWTGNDFAATLRTYTVSGTITHNGSALAGATVSISGSSTTSTTTDASGNYSFELDGNGNYLIDPSKLNYNFAPTTLSTTTLSGNWTGNNFTASLSTYTISGTVTLLGSPLSGVTMSITGSTTTSTATDGSGNYSITLDGNGDYTLTPTKTGHVFSPTSYSTTTLSADQPASNFTATRYYDVSGTITRNGSALPGVTVSVSGSSTTSTITDSSGNYAFALESGGSYTLTPSKLNHTFAPTSLATATLSADWTGNDFAATLSTYTISGTVTLSGSGLSGVTMSITGSTTTSTTTDGSGNYSVTLDGDGDYTFTPSKTGYIFTPGSNSTTTLSASVTGIDFTATPVYTVSGTITRNGSALSGVTVSVTGSSTTSTDTDASGNYSFTLQSGNYTLTPTRANYTFSPVSVSTTALSGNWAGNDFAATVNTYTVSGTITESGSGLSGVTVSVTGSTTTSTTTDGSGNYSFTLDGDANYMLTPTMTAYVFSPTSLSTTTLSGNWTANDFTGINGYAVSGTIMSDGAALSGVTINVTGSTTTSTTTDASGNYSLLLLPGTYTLTPAHSGYVMSPLNKAVTVVAAAVTGNDFIGSNLGGRSIAVIGGPNGYAQPTLGYKATLKFANPRETGQVKVRIYTMRNARLVRTLETDVTAGTPAELVWDCINSSGETIGSGIYIAVVSGAGYDNEKIKIGVLK